MLNVFNRPAWRRAGQRCCVPLLAMALGASLAHADDLIKLPVAQTQSMVRQPDESYIAKVDLQLTRTVASLGSAKVIDVKFKDGPADLQRDEFSVEIHPAADHATALWIVMNKTSQQRLPGNYSVALQLAAKGIEPQLLELTLVRPSPVLALRSTVYIDDKRRDCELCRSSAPATGSIVILETSGKASLTQLTIEPVIDPQSWAIAAPSARICLSTDSSPATTSKDPCPQALTFDVPASSERVVYARTQGYFPPGTYGAKIDVRTPQLTGIATSDVQIVSRRSLLWIVGTVACGAFCGWFVRVYLRLVQDSADARIRASVALQAIRASLVKIADPRFQEKIREVERRLQNSAETGKPAEIVQAAIDANIQMDAIEKELQAALAQLAADLSTLHSLVSAHWDLPRTYRPLSTPSSQTTPTLCD